MALPKRVWSGQNATIDRVIARKLADLDEQIVRQVELAIQQSRAGALDVKELTKAHEALSDVLKRKQAERAARHSVARDRARAAALAPPPRTDALREDCAPGVPREAGL
jgi:sRNA-binding protein